MKIFKSPVSKYFNFQMGLNINHYGLFSDVKRNEIKKASLGTYLWIISWPKREFRKYPFLHIFHAMAILGAHRYNFINISKFLEPLKDKRFL